MVEFNTSESQPGSRRHEGHGRPERDHRNRGQAMVEYALILVLMAIAFGIAIAASGPAIGNVFCNVVHNLGGNTASPQGGQCGSTAPDLAGEGGNPPLFWATVTWIAQHPQGETPFPTPIRRPPSGGSGSLPTNTSTYTPTPSNTPTPTHTNTHTYTPTYTDTNTPGPSPTSVDVAHSVPYVDQISKPEWWRLDTGDFMGYSPWRVDWYDSVSMPITCSPICGISLIGAPVGSDPSIAADINGINFDWGTGIPSGSGLTDGDVWGADFQRDITVPEDGVYQFTLGANNYGTLYVDSTPILSQQANDTSTATTTYTVTAGVHTLRILYAENTMNASVSLNVTRLTVNPDDTIGSSNTCTWGRNTAPDTNDPVSVSWQFDNDPNSDSWPASQTCYLELRGYVDISGKTNPMLSFWEIWDLAAASGVTVDLQVGSYEVDGSGNIDRSKLNWQTVNLHNSGANYNWTRTQVDIRSVAPVLQAAPNEFVAFRFKISSGAGGSPVRWYIDDIQVLDELQPTKTFTVGDDWDLENANQMDDFIFDGDSNRTIAANPSLPNTTETWRWDLTSTHTHSGSLAWDDSPAGNYQDHSQASSGVQRVHYLEMKYPVNLVTPPAADDEGDTGIPLLTFWQAFDIKPGASIRVQYTTDARDETPDTWVDIPVQGILIDYNNPVGTSRTNLVMQPVEIDLTNIPLAVRAAPFRLRFALYVDGSATQFGDGWYIDDIKIERQTNSPFFAYPFIDDAEDSVKTDAWWDPIGGEWGATTEKGGAASSATAYSDSPLTQYDPGDTQTLQLHYAIDLLHDTPGNTAGGTAATNPVLTFWHQRSVNSGATFSVELWTASTGWDPIWTYDSASDTSFRTQNAWERVEINLMTALETVSGQSWATIIANAELPTAITDDDDIKVRFVFAPGAATPADGVYVDEIHIENGTPVTHKLWDVGLGGNGTYLDNIDPFWASRWYHGGTWGTTNAAGFVRSGSLGLADSPATSPSPNYAANTFSVLELIPVIDMTGPTGTYPMLTFWTRYQVGSDDTFRVEISSQNAGDTAQNYNKIGGWTAWTAQPLMLDNSTTDANADTLSNMEIVTWQRAQVNLSSFVGQKIRVRFVGRVPNTTNQADGMFVDEVAFTYNPRLFTLPFTDSAQNTLNWVAEGAWGLGLNYYVGSGTSPADFGSFSWSGSYFDCEGLGYSGCGNASTYTSIFAAYPLTTYPANSSDPAQPVGPETVSSINFNWGTTGRPLSDAAPMSFTDTFGARWRRTVTLSPGTYSFSTISDDGVRLWIDDYTGTNITDSTPVAGGTANSRYIINNWGTHSASLDYTTVTVTGNITRVLTLEFFDNTGDAKIILSATRSSYSFTESPNEPYTPCSPAGPTCFNGIAVVSSLYPGNSSLMLNGYFSLPATGTPRLEYQRMYQVRPSNFFYVEVSTDGGFNWTVIQTLTNAILLPPSQYWEQQNVSLSAYSGQPHLMIRFRFETRGSAGATGDGIYLTNIRIVAS